jgi:hypothetical protein
MGQLPGPIRRGEKVDEWTGVDAFMLMKHDGRWKIVTLALT